MRQSRRWIACPSILVQPGDSQLTHPKMGNYKPYLTPGAGQGDDAALWIVGILLLVLAVPQLAQPLVVWGSMSSPAEHLGGFDDCRSNRRFGKRRLLVSLPESGQMARPNAIPTRSASHDLFRELPCQEIACLCAGVRFTDRALDKPEVQDWIKRLCEEGSAYSNFPIGAYTRCAVGEWLETVNGICFARNEPIPRYFRRVQKALTAAMHD